MLYRFLEIIFYGHLTYSVSATYTKEVRQKAGLNICKVLIISVLNER